MHPYDPTTPQYVEGHLMVGYNSRDKLLKYIERKKSLELLNDIGGSLLIKVPVGKEDKWVKKFNKKSFVAFAEREGLCYPMDEPIPGGYVEEGPHPLPEITTQMMGEEGGGCGTTTRALGEEGGGKQPPEIFTTMALGEAMRHLGKLVAGMVRSAR